MYIPTGSDPTIDCASTPNGDHACVRCGGQFLVALTSPSAANVGYVYLQVRELRTATSLA